LSVSIGVAFLAAGLLIMNGQADATSLIQHAASQPSSGGGLLHAVPFLCCALCGLRLISRAGTKKAPAPSPL
jgi:hypothetical protein